MSYEQHRSVPAPMQPHSNGERHGLNFLLDQTQSNHTPPPNAHVAQSQHNSQHGSQHNSQHNSPRPYDRPIWARLPNHSPYTAPLDSLLGEFVTSRRKQLADGAPLADVVGGPDPSFAALIYPEDSSRRRGCHPVSALLGDIVSKFPDISALPEKVAVLYVMYLTLRWMICPCQACFDRLPDWIRPTAEQVERAHPAWVDHLPW